MSRPSLARLGATLLAVSALLAGCGLFGQEDPTVATRPGPAATATGATTVMLERGAAPRRPLRLRLRAGETTTVSLTVDLRLTQRLPGNQTEQVVDPPAVTETIRFRVDRVAGRVAHLSFEFTGATVDRTGTRLTDAEFVELTAAVQRIIGIGGHGQVTDRGVLRSFAYDLPAGLDPALAATLRDAEAQLGALVLPLPAEAVGTGARWRSTTRSTLSGLNVRQTTTYEVTSISGDRIGYRTTTTQEASDQAIGGHPATAPGARLVSSDVRGTGSGTTSLSALGVDGRSRLRGSQVVEQPAGSAGGKPPRVSQELTLTVTIGPPTA